jgi:hypothetical protein
MEYQEYLKRKIQNNKDFGFEPLSLPDYLFDFQKYLVEWALRKGRAAIFADCGLGKSPMELVWADEVSKKTNGKILLLTPLAVGQQMQKEAEKFGIETVRSRDGSANGKIIITNYEQLHQFNPNDFTGIVCDESSILKSFNGSIKHQITIFMRKIKYRLLATATAAPNDFIELGTSSEALGYLGYMDMLNKFFKNDMNNSSTGRYRGETVKWRLKGHAELAFWRWITSWARAVRKPSDLEFNDDGFNLPELIENDYLMDIEGRYVEGCLPGMVIDANGLKEQRDEKRATISERCIKVAEIVNNTKDYAVVWCDLNDEGDLLEKLIPGSVQVSGKDSDIRKEEKLNAFSNGNERVLITKPKIGAWGLNWQHCNHTIIFPSHSYEQYYQAIRRFLRFGQKRNVNVDLVYTKGYINVIKNLRRKQLQADQMFKNLVNEMNNSIHLKNTKDYNNKTEIPKWL